MQEIKALFVIEKVFWLYYFITTNISTVYIKKIVPHVSGYLGFQICFHKLLQTFKFLITQCNKIAPRW